jgi:hypothetical protein
MLVDDVARLGANAVRAPPKRSGSGALEAAPTT